MLPDKLDLNKDGYWSVDEAYKMSKELHDRGSRMGSLVRMGSDRSKLVRSQSGAVRSAPGWWGGRVEKGTLADPVSRRTVKILMHSF